MMIEQFIDRLEQQGLLDKDVVEELRRKIVRSKGKKVTPEAVAKYLVDKGHLTRFQATKLVNDVTSLPEAGSVSDTPRKTIDADELTLIPEDDDLTVVREPGAKSPPGPGKKPAAPVDQELDALTSIDEDLFGDAESNRQRSEREAAEKQAAARAAAERVAAEKAAAQKQAAEKRAAEKRAAEKRAARDEQAATRGAGRREPPTLRREPAAAQPPVPPPPLPPVDRVTPPADPVMDDVMADMEATSNLASGGYGSLGGGRAPVQRKLQKSSEWDSTLLLVGGVSLGVLLVIGTFLYLSLTRGAAEDMFGAAESAYADESYAQAIKLYDKYLEAYPNHEKAGLARVKREVARLRQVFKTPDQGLKVANEILPAIENEEEFPQVRDELASMLPQIAREFVDQALLTDDSAKKEALVAETADAMKLVNNSVYIPTTLRKSQQTMIATIEEDVARVQREINRETSLRETVAAINQSVAAGETKAAYEVREALLSQYPGLDTNELLHEAVLKISDKARERVQLVKEPLQAKTDDPAPATAQAIVLSHRMGQAVGGVTDYVVYVLAEGSIFALDASTGNVLWRRFVGMDTTMYPQSLSTAAPRSDAIAVDQRSQELMRLDAQSGKLLWRLPIGEPFATPVILEDRIYVSARSGKIYVVDSATGNVAAHILIPQPLDTPADVTDRRPYFYQLGDQDNLYVISRDTLECKEVFYVGHKRGTIAVPPVMALGYLFIAENVGPDFCNLHIIATDQNGLNLKYAQDTQRLQGQVLVPPVAGRRRVLVVTDSRAVELFAVDPNNPNARPVTTAGRINATSETPILSYPLLDSGYMWTANNRFTKYQVQVTTGKLPTEWVLDEQDVYVAPLQLMQDVIIHVRRRQSAPGFTVAATRINDKDPSWQTEIAVPPRSLTVKGNKIESVTARGRLFEVDPASVPTGIVTEATASATRDERLVLSLTDGIEMGEGQFAFTARSGYNQIVFYKPQGDNAGLRLLTLTVPLGEASIEPIPFGGGLLVPLRDGLITLADPVTGADRVDPFQPEIEAGSVTHWNRGTVLDGGQEFVISNDRQKVFRVGIDDKPRPHLQQRTGVTVSDRMFGPLAALSAVCYGVTRGGSGDALVNFDVARFEGIAKGPAERACVLGSAARWRPGLAGDRLRIDGPRRRAAAALDRAARTFADCGSAHGRRCRCCAGYG